MLTSLLDMFTIILIFLIVSVDTEDQGFRPHPEVKLPKSSSRSVFKESVNVAISKSGVYVDPLTIGEGKVKPVQVATLNDGRFSDEMYERLDVGGAGGVPEIENFLRQHMEKAEILSEYEGTELDERAIVTIQAQEDTDYQTIYLVLRSAAGAGFFKYRLAITKTK